MIKLLRKSQKRSGVVLLNSILILSVAIMVVSYSNAYFSGQVSDYQQLDELYKQQINKKINKSNKIDYREFRNP